MAESFFESPDMKTAAESPQIVDETRLIRRVTTITSTQVRTLNATPVSVVPAPGAGFFVEVDSVRVMLDYNSAAYDGVAGSGEDLSFKYTNASGAKVTGDIAGSGFGDATSDQQRLVRGVAVTPVSNAAIVAHILSAEWYAAAGNSPLLVEVFYRVRRAQL